MSTAEDIYPSEEELATIRAWPHEDFGGLMEFVRERWWPDGRYGWRQYGRDYRISTGGWSGNEDLVGALKQNRMFWLLCWQLSRRGGSYEFELPKGKEAV